jgi:hypothetical protein
MFLLALSCWTPPVIPPFPAKGEGPLLAYEGLDDRGQAAVFLHLAQKPPARLRLPGPARLPTQVSPWSPDADRLVVIQDEGLFTVSMSSGRLEPLNAPEGMVALQGWFPDGQGLVTCTPRGHDCALVRLDAEPLIFKDVSWSSWSATAQCGPKLADCELRMADGELRTLPVRQLAKNKESWTVVFHERDPLRIERQRLWSDGATNPLHDALNSRLSVGGVQPRPEHTRSSTVLLGLHGEAPRLLVVPRVPDQELPQPAAAQIRSYGWSQDGLDMAWVLAESDGGRGQLVLVSPGESEPRVLAEQTQAAWWRPGPGQRTHELGVLEQTQASPTPLVVRHWDLHAGGLDLTLSTEGRELLQRMDPLTGELAWSLEAPGVPQDLSTAGGRTFISMLRGGVFELVDGGFVERIPYDDEQRISGFTLSLDGSVLVTSADSERVHHAWSTDTGELLGSLSSHLMLPLPDGDFLVTHDKVVSRWVPGREPEWLPYATQPLPAQEASSSKGLGGLGKFTQYSAGVLPAVRRQPYASVESLGARITLASSGGALWVVDHDSAWLVRLKDGELLEARTGEELGAHLGLLSPDGRLGAHASRQGLLRIYEAESGRQLGEAAMAAGQMRWTADGRALVGHLDGSPELMVWELSSLYEDEPPSSGPRALDLLPD